MLESLKEHKDLFWFWSQKTVAGEERGAQGDGNLKERFENVKKQLWNYQQRDNVIQDKEEALAANEKAYEQVSLEGIVDLACIASICVQKTEKLNQDQNIKRRGEGRSEEILLACNCLL